MEIWYNQRLLSLVGQQVHCNLTTLFTGDTGVSEKFWDVAEAAKRGLHFGFKSI